MRHLPQVILPIAALAGISIIVAQEATPAPDTRPDAAVTRTAIPAIPRYDYRVEMLVTPQVNSNGSQAVRMPQLPSGLSEYEIVNVSVVKANIAQAPNDPNPPKTREVLIYTLRKPLPSR